MSRRLAEVLRIWSHLLAVLIVHGMSPNFNAGRKSGQVGRYEVANGEVRVKDQRPAWRRSGGPR